MEAEAAPSETLSRGSQTAREDIIEGGMVSTNDDHFYQLCRSLRSHGMVREFTDEKLIEKYTNDYPDLNQDFVFIGPAHNFRSTEINAVLGLCQLE